MEIFARTKMLIGENAVKRLNQSHVAIFGVGGVGGFAAEALARSGVGQITIFDSDTVAESNLNRQIIATTNSLGKSKVDVMRERLVAINSNIKVNCNNVFYLPENTDKYPLNSYDYIVDAVDTVSAKLQIITGAKAVNVPVISSMGTGGKLDITALKVADISKTNGCPLARVMRRELKARGITDVKVVYSTEPSINSTCVGAICGDKDKPLGEACVGADCTMAEQTFNGQPVCEKSCGKGKAPIPSMIFVPAAAGLMLAREVVLGLIKK